MHWRMTIHITHSELQKEGDFLFGRWDKRSEKRKSKFRSAWYSFKTRDELECAFSVLEKGGTVGQDMCEWPWSPCAAVVTDQFGVNWHLTLHSIVFLRGRRQRTTGVVYACYIWTINKKNLSKVSCMSARRLKNRRLLTRCQNYKIFMYGRAAVLR